MIKVIHEVDIALRSLIEREATDGTEVEVVFDAPTKDWASRRNVPTIDVYLYDIREDLRRRERGLINEYDDSDHITTRHLPPRHFKLSYLVTAWTQRPEDEHRLLAALLSCFLRHDAIPMDLITGPLAELGLPVPVTVALPPPEDRSFADVWSALGGELKPSLDVVVSAPMDTGQQYAAGPPVVKPTRIALGGVGGWPPREARDQAGAAADGRRVARPAVYGLSARATAGAAPDGPVAEAGGGGGAADAGSATGSRTAGSASPRARSAGGTVAMARGMSWKEFAASGSRPAAPADTPDDASTETAEVAADNEKASAADTPKPTRRRRQGGITEK